MKYVQSLICLSIKHCHYFHFQELEAWTTDFALPTTVWLAGFFNPQSFLTAIMQSMARRNEWPLDRMCLSVEVTKKNREDMTAPPREGSYVHGLFMEGTDHSSSSVDKIWTLFRRTLSLISKTFSSMSAAYRQPLVFSSTAICRTDRRKRKKIILETEFSDFTLRLNR